MKLIKQILLLILLSNFVVFAQVGTHHYDKIKNNDTIISSNNEFNSQISKRTLTKTVFGYLPYWELSNANIRFDLLTHIAIFDFVLTSDGSLVPPYNWPEDWLPLINEAQLNDVKVVMTISNLSLTETDSLIVSSLINNQSTKYNFFDEVHNLILSYNLDGINIDFENLKFSERGDPINNFMQELRDSLNTWFNGKELSFATPAVNWGNMWKLKELSEICDYLFIMGYDYHGSWSENAGPVAPLTGNEVYNRRNYETTIANDYADVESSKIILGVPYYGAEWLVENNDPYTTVIPDGNPNSNWVKNVNYEDVHNLFADNNYSIFDEISKTTYVMIPQGSKYKLIWMDTVPSLELKYDFVLENNLKGIGIWSLGKDGNRTELWDLIEQKFADTTTSVEEENLLNEFTLFQNYPNPFNPTTTIKFNIPTVGTTHELSLQTRLIVYNSLGQKISELISKILSPGTYEIEFDASDLPSGIYFYRLNVNGITSAKKMVLIR